LDSQGYLEGLTDAGWAGDSRQVRLGYLGALLARWGWAVPSVLAVALDEPSHVALEAARGRPIAELMDEWGRFVSAQFDALDEVEALLGVL
jgi:hypothetical protein